MVKVIMDALKEVRGDYLELNKYGYISILTAFNRQDGLLVGKDIKVADGKRKVMSIDEYDASL